MQKRTFHYDNVKRKHLTFTNANTEYFSKKSSNKTVSTKIVRLYRRTPCVKLNSPHERVAIKKVKQTKEGSAIKTR